MDIAIGPGTNIPARAREYEPCFTLVRGMGGSPQSISGVEQAPKNAYE